MLDLDYSKFIFSKTSWNTELIALRDIDWFELPRKILF